MLAYGVAIDYTDEYCQLNESTTFECLKRFVKAIQACFESNYLRQQTLTNVKKQMKISEERGFPNMFTSIDYMYWSWKNCPVAWQGQFQDKNKIRSIILDIIVDQSLWTWHTFFGLSKGNNDVIVLDSLFLVAKLLRGEEVNFMVNGTFYPCYYLLVYGFYPLGVVLCKPYLNPKTKSDNISPKCKEHKKMLKEHLVFSKLDGQ
jgi:hypothetical protein